MPRTATGTVQYRPARSSDQPGKWFGRITCIDNSRPWVELGKWPNSPQGRARAKETARAYTERFRAQGIVGAPQRGPRAVAQRKTRASEASQWWTAYSKHRASLSLISIDGAYRTHIAPHSHAALEGIGLPSIHFGVGTGPFLADMRLDGVADAVGVDWRMPLDEAIRIVGGDVAVQGNIDPALLQAPWPVLEAHVRDVIERGRGAKGHILNLGHGVPPETDPDQLTRIVQLAHGEI